MKYFSRRVLISFILNAATTHAAQWEIPSQGLQEVVIRGRVAKLQVQRGDDAMVRVSVSGANEKNWQQDLQNNILKISGPDEAGPMEETKLVVQIPATVQRSEFIFEEVRAEVKGLSRFTMTAMKGKISGEDTGEGVRYFLQKGEIQSTRHQGALEIESYSAKVTINDGLGALKIRLFGGELLLNTNQGALNLESHSAAMKINGQQGILHLQLGKGSLVLNDFSGRLEGVSADGQLQINLKPDAMIDLQADRGKVSVVLPGDSGANINVRSVTGAITVPGPLKAAREGRYRVAKGRLSGTFKGSVNIRADEANVGIR